MLASRRNDRVRAAMRQEISNMLQRDLKDPRLGFATVTDVRVSGDLQHVQVYFAYDDSIERGARLLRLISEVQSEEAAAQRDEETDN